MRGTLSCFILAIFLYGSVSSAETVPSEAVPPATMGKFRRKRSRITARLGSAHHSAVDLLSAPGKTVAVAGKFAYGRTSKDLEKEDVVLWLKQPSRWVEIGRARTDGDGRVAIQIPGKHLKTAGPHRFSFVVPGDLSMAFGTVWVVEKGTQVAVFDIDGTLTSGDSELIEFMLAGSYIHMRPAANWLVAHYAKKGLMPIYLTGRPYLYNPATKAWLRNHRFPRGPVVTTNSVMQGMPGDNHVGHFKRDWLRTVIATTGIDIQVAYGNATTDVCAFAESGIEPSSTYIVGKNGGKACNGHGKTNYIADFAHHLSLL